ncbi:MAG: ribbon-helix-helix protein, CopG family [Sphaerochaeta sp.]|jgi:CopG family nickel-responsive transcriptional regulator|nr:ribbon-helix-helix protein, CopG family [Sphaerochaeta sp.]MDX9915783.1 ribbon-helix-helix protein, CopG family [Sphaerochaeta sp.]
MGETIRFGVSMDSDLVRLLDQLTHHKNHDNRSETIRELVRDAVIAQSVNDDDRTVIGTLTILFHHKTRLPRSPISAYPSLSITANLQFHIEGEILAKVLIVKGKGAEIDAWAQKLLASSKVIGKLTYTATDELFGELLRE